MRNIKRFISALICLTIVLSTVPSMAFVSSANTSDGFRYTFNSDGVTVIITKYTGNESDLTIPDTIDGFNVTAIDSNAFSGCKSLKTVTIPGSVKKIGWAAFEDCVGLTSVTIESGVTRIGADVFLSCKNLTSIFLPDGIIEIGMCAFEGTAYYNDSNNWQNEVLFIGEYLIRAKTSISGAYTVPSYTKTISDRAFYSCDKLTSVSIPDGLISIGDSAFSGCRSLTSFTIPDSVKNMGNNAFYSCSSLSYVNMSEGITAIGNSAFEKCNSLTYVIIPDSVTSIGMSAFKDCSKLTFITIPDGVTIIGDYAFEGCKSLASVTIPESVTYIGNDVFYSCSNLRHVFYKGTEESWNNIRFAYVDSCLASATRHYNATGDELMLVIEEPTFTYEGYNHLYCTECESIIFTQNIEKVENPFIDVDINAWYSKPVSFALYFNIFSGMSPTTFEPNSSMTRAMFVTVLGRLDGAVNDKNKGTVFTDVPTGEWYSGYIAWAAENKIVSGTSPTTFAPNSNITRQEMCVIMNNYCKYAGITLTPQVEKKTFLDSQDVAGWAKNAVEICQLAGLVSGKTETKQGVYFEPLGKATRAEVATILRKFCLNF